MNRALAIALIAIVAAAPAFAMTRFLVAQWVESGDRFCRYDNGTVLNVGVRLCPLSING